MVASSGSLDENIRCSNRIDAPSEPLDSEACAGIVIDHDMAKSEATINSENHLPMYVGLGLLGIEHCVSAYGAVQVRGFTLVQHPLWYYSQRQHRYRDLGTHLCQ